MPNDFGFYGKGAEGYVHYMQAFNESKKGGGGGKPPSGSGCLTLIITISAFITVTIAVLFT